MNKKGIVVLSFDDGREDLIRNVIPVLNKYKLPATFNITTGYIDGSLLEENRFCSNKPICLEDLTVIKNNELFEIAAHGDQHLNTIDDIGESIKKLKKWKIIDEQYGFASPCHGLDSFSDEQLEKLRLKLGLKYIRIGTKLGKNILAKIIRRLSFVVRSPIFFLKVYAPCLNKTGTKVFKCVPYNKGISLAKVENIVLHACCTNRIVVILFHSVLKINDNYYKNTENIDYDEFEQLCKWLDDRRYENILVVETNLDATRTE